MKNIMTCIVHYLFTIFLGLILLVFEFMIFTKFSDSLASYIVDFINLTFITYVVIKLKKNYNHCSCILIITCITPALIMLCQLVTIPEFRPNNNLLFTFALNWISINIICLFYRIFRKKIIIINFKNFVIISTIVFAIFYLYALIYIVFFRDVMSIRKINLIPFVNTIIPYINGSSQTNLTIVLFNIFANILLLLPLGFYFAFFTYKIKKKINWFMGIVIISVISLIIETLQYIFALGVSDIDDIIMNLIGGILGILLFTVINKIDNSKRLTQRISPERRYSLRQ